MSETNQRTSTLASFFILTAASAYNLLPLIKKGFQLDGIHLLLILIFIQGIIGSLRYALSKDVQIIENSYQVFSTIRQHTILPLFVYQLCLLYSVSTDVTNVLILLLILALASTRFVNISIFIIVYLGALFYLCHINKNYYGLNAGVTFAFAHFVITDRYTYLDFPAIDFYNYCLCFYIFFCWKALND